MHRSAFIGAETGLWEWQTQEWGRQGENVHGCENILLWFFDFSWYMKTNKVGGWLQ